MPLDSDVRLAVEKNIDEILKDPEGFLKTFQMALWEMGIQPNLEAILAHITGHLIGIANGVNLIKHERLLTPSELKELADILRRRAWEMRQEFIKALHK